MSDKPAQIYDEATFDIAEPSAAALIESLRSVGYGLPAAIADIIDNSISADAKNIWISFAWLGGHSHVLIEDDGRGMSSAELVKAMTLGSVSPLLARDTTDLGRFGMGLKTASFSQCRRLTVGSKRDGLVHTREWDLDYVSSVERWYLLRTTDDTGDRLISKYLDKVQSGTIVLWRNLDRVVPANVEAVDSRASDQFYRLVEEVENHLAMIYHRFLSGKKAIALYVNGKKVAPWDPFLIDHDFTQEYPEEFINTPTGTITVRAYVLPHHSKLSDSESISAEGPDGWLKQQGLYIYRKKRMLVGGSWQGLRLRTEPQFQLARVSVDIGDTLDTDWELDIKKSRARPPAAVRDRLKKIAEIVRERSRQTFRSKGKVFTKQIAKDFAPVWVESWNGLKLSFRINRQHPLIKATTVHEPAAESVLRMIEETIPSEQIALHLEENPRHSRAPFETPDGAVQSEDVLKLLQQLIAKANIPVDVLEKKLLSIEPFNRFPELVSSALRAGGKDGRKGSERKR